MKKMTKFPLLVILLVFIFAACKKKEVTLTTAEKVQGTWQLKTDIYHENVGGVESSDTTSGNGNFSIEFRSDNKYYVDFQGQKDTSTYTLTGNTQITLNTQVYDIKTLTSSLFVIYSKTIQGQDSYEYTDTLIK